MAKKTKSKKDSGETKSQERARTESYVWFTLMVVGVLFMFMFVGMMFVIDLQSKITRLEFVNNQQYQMVNEIHQEVVESKQNAFNRTR